MNQSPWIFVIGAPRSGTSLLRRLISSQGRLYVSPELRILELVKIAGMLAVGSGPSQRLSPRGLAMGRRFADALARNQLQALGKVRYGDKYPPYCAAIPELDALFPGAMFIHIVRDGRDVVASLAQVRAANRGWRREANIPPIPELAKDWASFVIRARQSSRKREGRYHELRYEHLLADPVPVLRAALRFLGEDIDAAMIEGMGQIRPGRSWRETLSPSELQDFAQVPIAEQLVTALGYPPTPLPCDRALQGAPADAVEAAVARGEGQPALWAARGGAALAAGQPRAAVPDLLRAIRGPEVVADARAQLLAMPETPESVFAAINSLDAPSARPALVRWAVGRGLDEAAAAALFAGEAPEVAA